MAARFNLQKLKNRAFLVLVQTRDRKSGFLDESFEEMKELARAALVSVVGGVEAKIQHPSPSHFIRSGKLLEVVTEAKKCGANCLLFNVELTPVQARNIEKEIKLPVVDRTGLILDIFGRRAQSREGQLQVELARLNYILPRLGGLGGVMSRLGGGIGTRGPGEQELERDRRKIRGRIERVKEELKKVHQHRELLRQGRKRRNFLSVALVGYTNAGKSTLLNALTGADTYVEEKMFATLDPKVRIQNIKGKGNILFVDTVGFLRELPHGLVESFHATLEEVAEADLLIHVLDVTHPQCHEFYATVLKVLEEIKANHKPMILALNKSDLLDDAGKRTAVIDWPGGILISAKMGLGTDQLMESIQIHSPRKTVIENSFSETDPS